jgi:hypothetical protein
MVRVIKQLPQLLSLETKSVEKSISVEFRVVFWTKSTIFTVNKMADDQVYAGEFLSRCCPWPSSVSELAMPSGVSDFAPQIICTPCISKQTRSSLEVS